MSIRLEMLRDILNSNPTDAFTRYSLAMEYTKAGQLETALSEFQTLVDQHPDYSNGYFMAAQALAGAGRTQDACQWLDRGIAAAIRTGNSHAQSEMEAMRDELS